MRLRAGGWRISYAPVKGRASAEVNAAIIQAHIAQERAATPDVPIVIVAYSKGV
jgi:triacylglycerol esterase/lipase EstA (alpha/beta hydrolase family)